MISFKSEGHTIKLPENTPEVLGHDLVLINPLSIKKLMDRLVDVTPVSRDELPVLCQSLPIESETLPEIYQICSSSEFDQFILDLKLSIDLITLNEMLSKKPITTFYFSIKEFA